MLLSISCIKLLTEVPNIILGGVAQTLGNVAIYI